LIISKGSLDVDELLEYDAVLDDWRLLDDSIMMKMLLLSKYGDR
jgi:hypothetical protein